MRLLFACLALFIATAAFAQTDVQDTFYGVKIRSSYNEMKASTDLKDIMKDKYKYYNWGYRHAYDWTTTGATAMHTIGLTGKRKGYVSRK